MLSYYLKLNINNVNYSDFKFIYELLKVYIIVMKVMENKIFQFSKTIVV